MAKVVYVGHFDEVEVPEAGIVARQGEPVEVPDDLARCMLEQDIWSEAPAEEPAARGARRGAGGES